VTAPTELTHPLWCLRERCAERGWHASRPLVARQAPDSDPLQAVTCRLIQLVGVDDVDPYVNLTAGTGGGAAGPELVMSIQQARILKRFLGRLVEMAERA
jgi:hypothetical protein